MAASSRTRSVEREAQRRVGDEDLRHRAEVRRVEHSDVGGRADLIADREDVDLARRTRTVARAALAFQALGRPKRCDVGSARKKV
jgi:hypothetical protein